MNLSQSKITSLQLGGFFLDNGHAVKDLAYSLPTEVIVLKDSSVVDSIPVKDPTTGAFVLLDVALQFNIDHSRDPLILPSNHSRPTSDGDKRPTLRDVKLIRYVARPSTEHLKKMEDNKSINCTLMKYVKVPSPSYGVVMTICTPQSMELKQVYEVSISNYPSCSCLNFKFLKTQANQKWKWLPCKHLYFVLQKHFSCMEDDVFIHCPGWIPNEAKLLLDRAS